MSIYNSQHFPKKSRDLQTHCLANLAISVYLSVRQQYSFLYKPVCILSPVLSGHWVGVSGLNLLVDARGQLL